MRKLTILILFFALIIGNAQTSTAQENGVENPIDYNEQNVIYQNANRNQNLSTSQEKMLLSLAEMPNVINNPTRTEASYNNNNATQANNGALRTMGNCEEENPNDFTFENGYPISVSSPYKTANDITVPADENFTLNNITASIFINGQVGNVAVNYYSNVGGVPGVLIGSEASATINSQTLIGNNLGIDVNELEMTVSPFVFEGQPNVSTKYWIELVITDSSNSTNVYWVVTSSSMVGSPSAQYANGWFLTTAGNDGVYIWKGTCTPIGEGEIFPSPYCGPVSFSSTIEPITSVSVAGIYNRSNAAINGVPAHEDFTSIEGEMKTGRSYQIALEGNTNGASENKFVVFIDWNQNDILDDAGEVYEITETINNSTGTDGQQATGIIQAPANAMVGTTRMRIKKIFGSDNYLNPCIGTNKGQVEDYSIVVSEFGVSDCSEENPNDFTFEDGYVCAALNSSKTANDLTVSINENFTLTNITASVLSVGAITNVAVNYYDDAEGLPGTLIGSEPSATIDSQSIIGNKFGYNVNEIELTVTPFLFEGQTIASTKYWIELSVTNADASDEIYWVVTSSSLIGRPTARFNDEWVIGDSSFDGVYIWKGNCELIDDSFFPAPYCGPIEFSNTIEPITLVSVAGINNVSDAGIGNSPAHEDFTTIEGGTMEVGNSYSIALEGNTNGVFLNRFVVFIDWNQNGILDDAGEVYQITETIRGSTGTDGQQATGLIEVPTSAMAGTTRMRVKKLFGNSNLLDPCLGALNGQAEDYTLQVIDNHSDFVFENNVWTPTDPAGVSTSVDNIRIVNGTAVFSTNIIANTIIIDTEATLKVENILSIVGDINNNGDLIFVSSETANGELGFVPSTSTISGNATVQRYMKNKRSYRMVSSAVTTTNSIHANWQENATSRTNNPAPGYGTHITGTTIDQQNGFDATDTGTPSMFTVNVENQQFQPIANTNVNTLSAGEAYLLFVRGDRSIDLADPTNDVSSETILRATGSLHTGAHTQSFPMAAAGDFVMVGNPYQSSVDINSLLSGSNNVNSNQYYAYDPTLGDYGAYVTVLLPEGTNTSSSAFNQYLQPGQGIQIAALNAEPEINFQESNKAPGNFTSTNRNPIFGNNMLTVQLYTTNNFNTGGSVHDSFGINFAEGNNNNLTAADAVKPMNFYENLAIINGDAFLSLEQREMPEPSEIYSIYTAGYKHADYTFNIIVEGLEESLLYLDDAFTGTSVLLESGENNYSFHVEASNPLSVATDRFSIRTAQRLGINDSNFLADIHIFPNPLNENVFYINSSKLNGEQLIVKISDLTGQLILDQTLDCQADTIAVPIGNNITSGVYLVTLKIKGDTQTYKLIKK